MYYNDHVPPHVHALYRGQEAQITIRTCTVLRGQLPPRALRLIREWVSEHQEELDTCWDRARRHESLLTIAPLE
jgi:hypothetical protein